jgi:hypothetical protein
MVVLHPLTGMTLARRLLAGGAIAASCLAGASAFGKPPRTPVAPMVARFPVATIHRVLVFSDPAYLSTSVEDTPYQRLRLCDEQGRHCRTMLDVRGTGGVSMPADKTLGLSPDGNYLLCLRMTAVDAQGRTYRGQYFESYDLGTAARRAFTTATGVTATSDNTSGWAADRPHALEVSAGPGKTVLALPAGDQ